MEHILEHELVLPHVTVNLSTIRWSEPSSSPVRDTHALFQRLSRDHSPMRLGELSAYDLLPRLHSVGFLPAGASLPLDPVGKPLRVLTCFYGVDYTRQKTGLEPQHLRDYTAALAVLRNKRLEMLMHDLHAEIEQPGPCSEMLVGSIADIMLVEVARFVAKLDRKGNTRGIQLALAPWQLLRMEERILAGPENGYPSLGELAELCGVSEGHLARAFKATTGWQIQKYVAEQRIKAAADMLAEGDASCAEVSRKLGFASPGYFSTVFREKTGKTPSEYRRQTISGRRSPR